ncbi:MAG TPA: Hsp20/alpha crystallin family protein [Polyangiaceae bacterium]|jgi:HSP20 family molecular chaperone IbpA
MAQQEIQKQSHAVERTKANGSTNATPRVDIYENDQELLLLADLPGVDPDGLSVRFDPPELRIEGRQENHAVVFTRAFELDQRIDPDNIHAELKHGVLRLHLKKSESFKPKKIPVKTG